MGTDLRLERKVVLGYDVVRWACCSMMLVHEVLGRVGGKLVHGHRGGDWVNGLSGIHTACRLEAMHTNLTPHQRDEGTQNARRFSGAGLHSRFNSVSLVGVSFQICLGKISNRDFDPNVETRF